MHEKTPKVIYDYSKCLGLGDCVDICPLELLELSENGRWCKPVDEKVEGEEHGAVNIVIENEMPECIACTTCEVQCTHEAIKIVE